MADSYSALKPYFLALYALFGIACLFLAVRLRQQPAAGPRLPAMGGILTVATGVLLLFVYYAVGSLELTAAAGVAAVIVLLSPATWRDPRLLPLAAAAAVIALSLAWWRIGAEPIKPWPLAAFAVILAALAFGLQHEGNGGVHPLVLPSLVFAMAGAGLMLDLGNFHVGDLGLPVLVHHWGAFLGPALQVKGGLVPYYDVPLQYGFGPTAAIIAACNGNNCWTGMHMLVTGTTLLSGLLILWMVLAGNPRRGWVWTAAATLVVFAAVFLWLGFAEKGNILMATPSVGGIRFLPLVLVAFLIFFGRWTAATNAMVPAVLWSPELAAMSVTVFGLCATAQYGFLRAALTTGALLGGAYAALILVHHWVYGVWLDPLALNEYVIHVPGPLPMNPFSNVLLLMAILGLGGWLLYHRAEDPTERRRDLVAVALLFAVSSYCLGRSHPNNICNLAPFLVLVAFRAFERTSPAHANLRAATAFGVAASAAALSFSPWTSVPFSPKPIGIQTVVEGFPSLQPDVERIRRLVPNTTGLGIADFGQIGARNPTEQIEWTSLDPTALWFYVPGDRRKLYIQRSAQRLKRAGWAIVVGEQTFFLKELEDFYTVSDHKFFTGTSPKPGAPPWHYDVVCLTPKPSIATDLVGPACPTGDPWHENKNASAAP